MNVKIQHINPRGLKHLPTKNPNVMDPQEYATLVRNINTYGFLQPVLGVVEDGEVLLIDGVHRTRAAIENNLDTIPVVIAKDRSHAEILRIAMNKLRGQLDLSEVSRQLYDLLESGIVEDHALVDSGFQQWEIDEMLKTINAPEEQDLLSGTDLEPPKPKPKTFALTLHFESESERARVKEALNDLGEGDLPDGLRNALDAAFNGREWSR